jgi:hypothetical protein
MSSSGTLIGPDMWAFSVLEVRALCTKRRTRAIRILIFGIEEQFRRKSDTGEGVMTTFEDEGIGTMSGMGPKRNAGPWSQRG